MPTPIPPSPVEKLSRFYYPLENNSATTFAGPTGLASDNVYVFLDGVSIPKDHPHYPWKFVAGEGVVFTGSNDTNDPPPLNGNLEVGRTTSLNFSKFGFPQGYHTDAKVLNRAFTDGLLQSNELWDSAEIANTAWEDASAVPTPNEAQANDYILMSDNASEWQIRNAAWFRNKMLLDTDDDVRFTQCSSTDLSCIIATDLNGNPIEDVTNNFWSPGTIYFSAVEPLGAYQTGDGKLGDLDWNRTLATDTEVELTKDGSTLILYSTSAVDFLSQSMATANRSLGGPLYEWPQNFDYWSEFRADASGNLRRIDLNIGSMGTLAYDGGRYPPVMTPSGNFILTNFASHWNTMNSTITARGNLSFPFYFHSDADQNDGDPVTLIKVAGDTILNRGIIDTITVVRSDDGISDEFKIKFHKDWVSTAGFWGAAIESALTMGATGHNSTGGGDEKPLTFGELHKVVYNVFPYYENDAILIRPMSDPEGVTPVHKSDAVTVRGWIHFHKDLL